LHRVGHVLPEVVSLDLLNDLKLLLNHRDVGFLLEQSSDLDNLFPQALVGGFVPKDGQLQAKHQQIKLLRLLIIVHQLRGQAGDFVAELALLLRSEFLPRLRLGVMLHQTPLRPHDEVVHVHRSDLTTQQLSSFGS
jgi:hypothetical protein